MKKCYIAGKIGDLSKADYELNFENAKREVFNMGFLPVSPVDLPHNHKRGWNDYMKEDIKALMECDFLYAQKNWRLSPGATIEINLALAVGINIIHQ